MQQEIVIEKKIELCWMLSFYGELLTQSQREIAQYYFEEDLSSTEIAQQLNISRQSVHDTLSRVEKKLREFEEKLGLCARFERIERELVRCRELLGKIHPRDESVQEYALLSSRLDELIRTEEQ